MSRVRSFFHAVWSGYLLTVIIALLNLLTIPIAVSALGKSGYGLWCAVIQLALFTTIFDLGMGPSMARFFTDYKEKADPKAYGDFLKSLFFVGVIQGLLFSLLFLCLMPQLPGLMGIPESQSSQFKTLVMLQLATSALGFPLRPLAQLLFAHQQIARLNGCYIVATLANAVVLIVGLKIGWGIYAYIAASWTAFVVNHTGLLFSVLKLRLLPSLRHARISLAMLKPLAAFSTNFFLITLGTQFITLAPGLLITRKLGIQALADWTVGTRLVLFAAQLVGRIPNSSEPVFWEMFAREELDRLRQRLLELVLVANSAAALFGATIVAMNVPFVTFWMASRVQWSTVTDLILVSWVVVSITALVFNMVPAMTKHLGSMKFVYLLEGGILIGLAYLPFVNLREYWQVALLLLVFECVFRFPYGLWRAWRDLNIPARSLAGNLGRAFGVCLFLLAVAALMRKATSHWSPLVQVIVNALVCGGISLPAVYFIGLPSEARHRFQQAVLSRIRRS